MSEWLNIEFTVTYGQFLLFCALWVGGGFVQGAWRAYRRHKAAGTWPSFREHLTAAAFRDELRKARERREAGR